MRTASTAADRPGDAVVRARRRRIAAFAAIAARFDRRARRAGEGDLGDRMRRAFAAAGPARRGLIGTDCPALDARDLRDAADLLADGAEVVMAPVEDGGYGLVAAWKPLPVLFREMPWSTPWVASLTRERATAAQLKLAELRTLLGRRHPGRLPPSRRGGPALERARRHGLSAPDAGCGLRVTSVARRQHHSNILSLPLTTPTAAAIPP